jgi:hypothetical protein
VINARKIRWTGHVSCKGNRRDAHKGCVRIPYGKKPLKDLGVNWRAILK